MSARTVELCPGHTLSHHLPSWLTDCDMLMRPTAESAMLTVRATARSSGEVPGHTCRADITASAERSSAIASFNTPIWRAEIPWRPRSQ